jgi:hypothetical protein
MKHVVAALITVTAVLGWAAIAAAEHDGRARPGPDSPVDLDLRVGRDGFDVGGRFAGRGGVYGAWLRGRLRERGMTLDGQVEHPGGAHGFSLDAEVPKLRLRTWEAPASRI